jgi:phosphatidylglycerophosphate synthase
MCEALGCQPKRAGPPAPHPQPLPSPDLGSPNAITLTGLAMQIAACAFAYVLAPDFSLPTSPWAPASAAFAAVALFVYSTLDNMDGKQARRTGTSSPLGLLFDHGCDAFNASMIGWLCLALQTGAGGASWEAMAMWVTPTLPFFVNTWEEFHTGSLILPVINGANEGLVVLMALLLSTAVWGPRIWAAPHVSFPALAWAVTPAADALRWAANKPASRAGATVAEYLTGWATGAAGAAAGAGPALTNLEVLLAATTFAGAVTAASQTANVLTLEYRRGGARAVSDAMGERSATSWRGWSRRRRRRACGGQGRAG